MGNDHSSDSPLSLLGWDSDPMPGEPMTDLGYANRLVCAFGDRLRYVKDWKRWLVWAGQRWAPDRTGQPDRWAKQVARCLTAAAEALPGDDQGRKAAVAAARRFESDKAISAALHLACSDRMIAVSPDQLDADPNLLNCPNGTLDLRTYRLRKHDPADLITKLAGAAYTEGADGPEFTKFLTRVQPSEEMREYLARLTGHALDGRVIEHVLPIFWGSGRNGKGTLIRALQGALGGYAGAADPELLFARKFEAHPTGVADLFGRRLAIVHEGDRGRYLAEATIKRLTGGDTLKARHMREDFWEFRPSHTFVMLTNHKPKVNGTDEALWARLRLVPWEVVIPPGERDLHLDDKLAAGAEREAVLAWMVDGHKAWRERGLAEPGPVTDATAAYRGESDPLARFIDERCLTGPAFWAYSGDLFAGWCTWCPAAGVDPGSAKAFTALLERKGFERDKSSRVRWKGIGLQGGSGDDG